MARSNSFTNLSEEKQQRIFQAAINEFADEGYKSASMNVVVKEAGISKGSLFQYFSTKLDLFDSIVTNATLLVKKQLRIARDESKGQLIKVRLSRLIRAGFDFIENHPKLAKIYFRLLYTGHTPFAADRQKVLQKQSIEFLESMIRDAGDEIDSNLDTNRIAFLVNGVMQQLLHAYYTENVDTGLGLYRGQEDELESWIETAVEFMSNGILKETK